MKSLLDGLLVAVVLVHLAFLYAVLWLEARVHGDPSTWPDSDELS